MGKNNSFENIFIHIKNYSKSLLLLKVFSLSKDWLNINYLPISYFINIKIFNFNFDFDFCQHFIIKNIF
jgi:hypothetical protein